MAVTRSTDPEMDRALALDAAKIEALGGDPGPMLEGFAYCALGDDGCVCFTNMELCDHFIPITLRSQRPGPELASCPFCGCGMEGLGILPIYRKHPRGDCILSELTLHSEEDAEAWNRRAGKR